MNTVEVQDLLNDVFEEDSVGSGNDMVENLRFLQENGTHLSAKQLQSLFILQENGLGDFANYILNVRKLTVPKKSYFDMINKFTLADRIKGNTKLKDVLKSSVTQPSQQVSMAELQPKGLRKSELND